MDKDALLAAADAADRWPKGRDAKRNWFVCDTLDRGPFAIPEKDWQEYG